MMSNTGYQQHFEPIAARKPPVNESGFMAWIQRGFFDGPINSLLTVVFVAMLVWAVPPIFNWTIWYAIPNADNAACREAHGLGACWGVVAEKGRLILFGRYPFEEQWRPLVASTVLVVLLAASCLKTFWRPALIGAWVVV